jgi:hypothetical protein
MLEGSTVMTTMILKRLTPTIPFPLEKKTT